MNNNLTELVFILDRSGSMSGLEADTIGGFNSMIAKQKKETGEAFVSTLLFDSTNDVLHDRVKISDIQPLTSDDYFTQGCTALYDALGDAIHHIGNIHKYAREEDVPGRTMFIITTDGEENSSRRYNRQEVRRLIERQREKYNWEFLFIGANIDAEEVAENIGIERSRAVNYHCDSKGTEKVFAGLAKAVSAVRNCVPEACCCALDRATEWREELDRDYTCR